MSGNPIPVHKVLAAMLSDLTGQQVVTYDEFCARKKEIPELLPQPLSISHLFSLSYRRGPFGIEIPSEVKHVKQEKPKDKPIFLRVRGHKYAVNLTLDATDTVSHLHEVIHKHLGEARDSSALPIFNLTNSTMNLHRDDTRTLQELGIENNEMILMSKMCMPPWPRVVGGGDQPTCSYVDDDLLDPSYDYDFRSRRDDGSSYYRGGKLYQRPYGFYRVALKVHNRYNDGNDWLGPNGIRTESAKGEWPVSYHGTGITVFDDIIRGGYDDSFSSRQLYGDGIYSSPDIEVAIRFGRQKGNKYKVDGKWYEAVLQNRVSLDHLKVVSNAETHNNGEYWIQPDDTKIRPYGVCIRPQ